MNRRQSLGGGAHGFIPLKGKILTHLHADQNNVISCSLALNSIPPSCASASRLRLLLARAMNNKFSKREVNMKKGFTLAEVLITLGIIGVVAAMTMPTVLSNYRKSQVVNGLKKNLALFSQAFQMAEAKHGFSNDWPTCNVDSDIECTKEFFENYLAPELKVIKTCIPVSEECWKPPKTVNGEATNYLSLPGNSSISNIAISAILNNGTSIYMWAGNQVTGSAHWQIWLDIDGPKKGLARIGGDVFGLMLWYKGSPTGLEGKGVHITSHHSSLDIDELYNHPEYGCSKNISGIAGLNCGALIQASGWKIPDDYPIKF